MIGIIWNLNYSLDHPATSSNEGKSSSINSIWWEAQCAWSFSNLLTGISLTSSLLPVRCPTSLIPSWEFYFPIDHGCFSGVFIGLGIYILMVISTSVVMLWIYGNFLTTVLLVILGVYHQMGNLFLFALHYS